MTINTPISNNKYTSHFAFDSQKDTRFSEDVTSDNFTTDAVANTESS